MTEILELIGAVICGVIIVGLVYERQTKYYFERALMAIGFCSRCKQFSVNHIKDYHVCSLCGKR